MTVVKETKEPPVAAPKPTIENPMPAFEPPPPIIEPIVLPTDSTSSDASTIPTKTDPNLPPPKPAHAVKPVEEDIPIVKEEKIAADPIENIPVEKPSEGTENKDS